MTVVAITGRKGSGKDTAAQALVDQGYVVVKFADALKGMLRALLSYQGVEDETIYRMLEGDLKEVPTDYLQGKTPRYAMQTLGTEWGRDLIGANLWTDSTLRRISKLPNAVVTDMRFPNELDAMNAVDAKTIRVVRPSLEENAFSTHASEAYIDTLNVDQEILNDKGVDELRTSLKLAAGVEQ